jgi:hypothetical protein
MDYPSDMAELRPSIRPVEFFRRIFKNRAQAQFQEQGIWHDPTRWRWLALEPGIIRRVENVM